MRKRIEDVSGGQRQDLPLHMIPDNAWYRIRNMEYDTDGALVSRGGTSAFNAIAIAGTMDNAVRYYRQSTAVIKTLVSAYITGSTAIYVADDGAGTFTAVTGGTALAAATPVTFLSFRDYLLMSNGTQTIYAFTNGTTKADCVYSDNNRTGKYLAAAANRVFVAGNTSFPNRIYFSEDGFWTTNPTTDCSFPNDNWIDIQGEYKDKITALATFRDELFIFRANDIWLMSGLESAATMYMRRICDFTGAVGPKAVAVTPYGIVFVGQSSAWWLGASSETPLDLGQAASDTLGTAVLTSACAGYYPKKNFVYVSFKAASGSTYNDVGLVVDVSGYPRKIRVYEHTIGANAFVSYSIPGDTGAIEYLHAATSGTSQGVMYTMDTGTQDAGVSFTCTLTTKALVLGDPDSQKLMKLVRVGMNAGTDTTPVSISVLLDRSRGTVALGAYTVAGFSKWGTMLYGRDKYGGGEYQTATKWCSHGTKASEVQLQLTKASAYAVKIFRYSLEYEAGVARRR